MHDPPAPSAEVADASRAALARRALMGFLVPIGLPGRYAWAVVAFLAALGLRHALEGSLPPGFPFLTFFPAVIATAFVAGPGPGSLCAALSGVAAWYFFIPPAYTLSLTAASALALGFFVAIAAVDIALIHLMQRATARLAGERALTARLYEEQRLMFRELQHRVANNMAFVAGFLRLQGSRVADDPAIARGALDDAAARLVRMGRIHRQLYDPSRVGLPLGEVLRELAQDLVAASGVPGISVRVSAVSAKLDLERLVPLSLLAAEVVTNSLKHAFRDRPGGEISLAVERPAPGRIAVVIADDGAAPPSPRPSPSPSPLGLGQRIIEGLAAQLGATLAVEGPWLGEGRGGGMRTRVEFDA